MNDYKEIIYKDYHKLSSKKGKYKIIQYYVNGNIEYEGYLINNKLHREDEPAYVSYYENGNVRSKLYCINGRHHREDGPAFIEYHKNGNIKYEEYCIDNRCHREDGPAWIWYYQNGNIDYERYYLCNKYFSKEDYYSPKFQVILNIVKMMDTWESKYNFIKLSLNKELNERL